MRCCDSFHVTKANNVPAILSPILCHLSSNVVAAFWGHSCGSRGLPLPLPCVSLQLARTPRTFLPWDRATAVNAVFQLLCDFFPYRETFNISRIYFPFKEHGGDLTLLLFKTDKY